MSLGQNPEGPRTYGNGVGRRDHSNVLSGGRKIRGHGTPGGKGISISKKGNWSSTSPAAERIKRWISS